MPTVFTRQIAMAKRMISKYGQSVTWRQQADGAPPDPTKPWEPGAASTTDHTVKIAFFPEDFFLLRTQQRARNDVIPEGYEVGYMAQQSFTPKIKDVVIRGSQQLRVAYLDALHPDGTDILYRVGLAE